MAKLMLHTHATVKVPSSLKHWLSLAATVAARELPVKVQSAPMSILVCGDRRMRTMNREYRGKDQSTDVLSFPAQLSVRSAQDLAWATEGVLPLGDLVISWPKTELQAKRFGLTPVEEFIHLFFHGFLHLLGYDHEISAKEEELMQQQEARLLAEFASLRKREAKKKAR